MNRYRIVKPEACAFRVEWRAWFWPFWTDITPYMMGFETQDEAREYATRHKNRFVVEEIV